jgi:glycosyltransferase involved in cell wall biosynthesis
LRIAIVLEAVFPESKGGLERWYGILSSYLAQSGHEVIYLNAQNVNLTRNKVTYVSISSSGWSYLSGGKRSISQAVLFSRDLYRWIMQKEVDAVYASSVPILSIFSASLACKRKKIPLLVEWFEIWRFSYWIRYSGFVFGIVGWLIQLIALQLGNQIFVFTNLIASRAKKLRAKRRSISKMPGLCSSEPKVHSSKTRIREDLVSIGRLVDEKQPRLAIEVVKNFIETGWKGTYWIVGTGPLATDVRQMISEPIFRDQVKFIENGSDEFVSKILSKSFALLHLSRREGYGLALVEAAYLGTPGIMVKYPENASIELKINPDLFCMDDEIKTIIAKLNYAYINQIVERKVTNDWVIDSMNRRSHAMTCNIINDTIELLGQNKLLTQRNK